MSPPQQQETETFTLSAGGLLYTMYQRAGFANRAVIRALILVALAWIPLFILSLIDGMSIGNSVGISFLEDYGVYGRILVAIPLLVIAEVPIDKRTRDVLRQFTMPKLIGEQDTPLVASAVHDAVRQKSSYLSDIIILLLIYSVTGVRSGVLISETMNTWYYSGGRVTPAGWYYAFVSLPIFQFLLIRWIYRLAIWTGLLWRISRLNLRLVSIHPDRMGGLGFLGLAQIPFGIIGFAGGAVISSYLMNHIVYRGLSLTASTGVMVTYIILAVLVLIAPILVFSDKLVALRANGILKYGNLGEDYVTLFENKWIKGFNPENEIILGSSDIQSLADLANSFNIVQNMRITPTDRTTITVLVASAAIPMIPVFFVALPFYEIIARVIGIFG